MGSSGSSHESESFNQKDWEIVEQTHNVKIWQNKRDRNLKVEEHGIFPSSEDELRHEREVYYLRKNSPKLVSALHFEEERQEQFCSSHYRANLYLEKIPIRLSDLEHIPFPDALHLYHQSLHGFYELAKQQGYFFVEDDHIGINERGVVKVWMNSDFSKSFVFGGRTSQQAMVESIINGIETNIDRSRMPVQNPSIRNYIYRKADKVNFDEAIFQFNSYVSLCNGDSIPNRLNCIDEAGGVYAIVHSLNHKDNFQEINKQDLYLPVNGSHSSQINQQIFIPNHYSQLSRPHNLQHPLPPSLNLNSQRTVLSPRFSSSLIEGTNQNSQNYQMRPIENIATFKRVESSRSEIHVNPSSRVVNNSVGFQNIAHHNGNNQILVNNVFHNKPTVIAESMINRNYLPMNQPVFQQPPRTIQQNVTVVRRADTLIANLQESQPLSSIKQQQSPLTANIRPSHDGFTLGQYSRDTKSQANFQTAAQPSFNFSTELNNLKVEKVISKELRVHSNVIPTTDTYKKQAKIIENYSIPSQNTNIDSYKWNQPNHYTVNNNDLYKNTANAYDFTSSETNNKYEISANDGKSSQDFLRKLKQMSEGKPLGSTYMPSQPSYKYEYEYGNGNGNGNTDYLKYQHIQYDSKYKNFDSEDNSGSKIKLSSEHEPYSVNSNQNLSNDNSSNHYNSYKEHGMEDGSQQSTYIKNQHHVTQQHYETQHNDATEQRNYLYQPQSNFELQSYQSIGTDHGQGYHEHQIKIATSNIIPNQHQYAFQHSKQHSNSRTGLANLDGHAAEMKYSRTQHDEQVNNFNDGGYLVNYDPDILADLQKLNGN